MLIPTVLQLRSRMPEVSKEKPEKPGNEPQAPRAKAAGKAKAKAKSAAAKKAAKAKADAAKKEWKLVPSWTWTK